MPPTYEYMCASCDLLTIASYKYEERPAQHPCDKCGGNANYTMSSPGITRASYLDGTKRFQDAKESSKLHKELAATQSDDRKKEIKKEIRRLKFDYTRKGIT